MPSLEFKTMVKALHAAGIEVILDVVFNHTAEGNESGSAALPAGHRQFGVLPLESGRICAIYENLTG